MPSRLLLAALVALSACKVKDPLYCDEDTPCQDPDRPFCDLAGEYPASEGIKRTCIPDPLASTDAGPDSDAAPETFCTPNEFVECSDLDTATYCDAEGAAHVTVECGGPCDAEEDGCSCEPETSTCSDGLTIHCGSDGRPAELETCALGCHDTGVRCTDVDPSNNLGALLDMTDTAPDVVLADGAIIDTDAGTIEDADGAIVDVPDFQRAAPANGVAVRVFAVKSLTIGDATVVGARALAIVSDGDVTIRGHVVLRAGAMPDSGCVRGDTPECTAGPSGGLICAGGGGGGFGTSGGDGGTATGTTDGITVTGPNGGSAGGTASLVPLRGGCAGGESESDGSFGDPGGSIQIVSRTVIRLEDGADAPFLDANGAGSSSNGGGGAGGGILLEAPRVVVATGTGLVANGGGGGCASDPGDRGRLSTQVAAGGTCPDANEGDGGSGGARDDTSPADGQDESSALVALGGGGGGGTGRIRVNVPTAQDLSQFGTISPAPTIGTLQTR